MSVATHYNTQFSVEIPGARVQVEVHHYPANNHTRLGQTIEDTLAALGKTPLSRIIELEGADYRVKRKRRGVPA